MLGIPSICISKANPATQSLILPHSEPTHPPGTIPVVQVPDRPAVRSSSGSPTSFAEAVTDPTEPFPTLDLPQEQGKHLSQTPVYRRDPTPRKVTQSQSAKNEASGGGARPKGESQVSATPGSSQTTRSETRASTRDPLEQFPVVATRL